MKIKKNGSGLKIKGGHGDGMKVGAETGEKKSKTEKHYQKAQMTKMIGYINKD